MPDTRDDVNEFLMGSGAKAFAFDDIGDRVKGVIVAMQKRQQTDMQTGDPVFWANGDPKYMLQVSLQTDLQSDDNDEGLRSVYLRGGNFTVAKGKGTSSLNAVKDAVKRSGSDKGIEIGGTLMLEYSGEAPKNKGGFNPAKLYTADYAPPTYGVDLDEMA
jgi:hypothetical protein